LASLRDLLRRKATEIHLLRWSPKIKEKEIEMAGLTKEMVHYVKFDIRQWTGPEERVRINQSLKVVGVEAQQYFTWHMTKQRREWINGVKGHDDEHWPGWQDALELWSDLRSKYGHGVNIWLGKPLYTKRYKKGQVQPSERLPESVAVMHQVKDAPDITLAVLQQEWVEQFVFVDSQHPVYNKTVSWRNPATTTISGTKKGPWQ